MGGTPTGARSVQDDLRVSTGLAALQDVPPARRVGVDAAAGKRAVLHAEEEQMFVPVPNENFSFGRGVAQLADMAPKW